jgi:CheY-like chemotaxis protein
MASQPQPVILIVDDDAALRDLLSKLMERLGIRTLTAADGAEGVATYMKNRADIDAILLDAIMPVMDGGEALLEMRKQGARQPVIAISGQPRHDIDRIFARATPDQVLHKPCTVEGILHVLARWDLVPRGKAGGVQPVAAAGG